METQNIDLLKCMGIEYSAQFVPFSRSRNKDEKLKSLNWTVTLKRNRVELTTDYMQGIGHHPRYKQTWGKKTWEQRENERGIDMTCEDGKIYSLWQSGNLRPPINPKKRILPKPDLKSVLWSLVLDSDVLEYSTFEDWAGCFGYDTDSRTAEKIYQDCIKIALKIKQMFSNDEMEMLREFYQDY